MKKLADASLWSDGVQERHIQFYEDLSSFKLYMLDCGLFAALAGAPASEMLVGKNVFAEFSGAFTEEYRVHGLRFSMLPYKEQSQSRLLFCVLYIGITCEARLSLSLRLR